MKQKWYTQEEIDFIIENYKKEGAAYCAEKLNRSVDSICGKYFRVIRENPNKVRKQQTFLHQNLFLNPEDITKESAYVLGWIWSDGYIIRNEIRLEIVTEDAVEIQQFLEKVGHWSITNRSRKNRKPQTSFCITCAEIAEWFKSMGKYPHSSESHEKILSHIPRKLQWHFLRGLIDGDGNFYTNYTTATTTQFSISSNYTQDWSSIEKFFNTFDIFPNIIRTLRENSKSSKIRITNKDHIIKFTKLLYENNDGIYLPRKYNKVLEIWNYWTNKYNEESIRNKS